MDNNRFAVLFDLHEDEAGPQEAIASPANRIEVTWVDMSDSDDEEWSIAAGGPWIPDEHEAEDPNGMEYEDITFDNDYRLEAEEARSLLAAVAESIHANRGTPSGDLEYSRLQHMLIHCEIIMAHEFGIMSIRGISGDLPFFTIHDRDNFETILARSRDRLEHRNNLGVPTAFSGGLLPPVRREALPTPLQRIGPANQTPEERTNLIEAARRTLQRQRSIGIPEHGENINLNAEEQIQMDRILQRSIMDIQWTIDHGEDAEFPDADLWIINDAVAAGFNGVTLPAVDWTPDEVHDYAMTVHHRVGHAMGDFPEPLVARARASNPLPLETSQIREGDMVGDHLDCSICHADYEVGEEWSTLPCAHRFHTECVTLWLDAENSTGRCPFHCIPPE